MDEWKMKNGWNKWSILQAFPWVKLQVYWTSLALTEVGVRWRAMFFDCVKRYKIAISKRRNYKTNVILLFVRKKVFLNEPMAIVTLSENILLEIRRQHTREARLKPWSNENASHRKFLHACVSFDRQLAMTCGGLR